MVNDQREFWPKVAEKYDRVVDSQIGPNTRSMVKPPKGFGKNVMTEKQLRELLEKSGFEVVSTETITDTSHSSNIPVEYVRAVKSRAGP